VTGFLDLSTSMTVNDLEPTKDGFLVNFSQFLTETHISGVNCDEMPEDRPRQLAYDIFSVLGLNCVEVAGDRPGQPVYELFNI